MKFLRQVGFEIKNILKSKFLFIISILIIAFSVAVPVIVLIVSKSPKPNNGVPMPVERVYYANDKAAYAVGGLSGDGQNAITVDGITVPPENPLYGQLQVLIQQKDSLQIDKNQFDSPKAQDLTVEYFDDQIKFYAGFAQYVTDQQDYRLDLIYNCDASLTDKFFIDHITVDKDVLLNAVKVMGNFGKGMDEESFKKKYIESTDAERQAAYTKANDYLNKVTDVVSNSDFPEFIALSIQQQNDQITSLNDNISLLQKQITDNPSQEDNLNAQIEGDQQQIKIIQTNVIPLLQYRLDKNIIPRLTTWQNNAIADIENNHNQLIYTKIMSQDDFMKDAGFIQQYQTYQNYVNVMQKQIDTFNKYIIIAQKSLDSDKPDMKYVTSGTRSMTVNFLNYSSLIALFAVLLGGWIIASEFQQGTIRLLMIRPKTRVKIILSKFVGAFAVCVALYAAGSLLNILVNGICFGFADYSFPNYSISGPTSFFAYYIPEFLACIVPILFGFSVAFMLSTLVKNIAVAIAAPAVCYVGSIIAMVVALNKPSLAWITWTPAPYAWMSLLLSYIPQTFAEFNLTFNIPYGAGLLLLLSAVCVFVSVLVFKKRDIAN
jgi:ABC-2 type transport system permease protein